MVWVGGSRFWAYNFSVVFACWNRTKVCRNQQVVPLLNYLPDVTALTMPKNKRSSRKAVQLKREFARHLRKQRQKQNWSLRQMAERSGISLTRLWNYEQGNHSPNLTALIKLAGAFKLSLSRFVKPLE